MVATMTMGPLPGPSSDDWVEYRRLVLAELARLDARADQLQKRIREEEDESDEKDAELRTEVELLKARFVGFTKEIESVIREELQKAPKAPPTPVDPKATSDYVRGMWEFRVALAGGIVSLLIALLALLK